MRLLVTFGKATHEIKVSPETTLQAVMLELETMTGALVRAQKLIYKGRVLGGGDQTVEGAKLKDSAKLLLLAGAPGAQSQVRLSWQTIR